MQARSVLLWLLSLTLIYLAIATDSGELEAIERNKRIISLTKDYKENELDSVFYKIDPNDEEEEDQTVLNKFKTPPFKPFELIPAFTKALDTGDLSLLKYIFDEEGINPNYTFENNNSFLHYSCDYNRLNFVKYLIEIKKLDPNQRNIAQVSCVHLASMRGSVELLDYLVQKGGNLNVKDLNLEMPIHRSITGSNLDTLKYLIDRGSDIRASNILGYQPIHYSAFFNCLSCLKILIEQGVDINEKTKYSVLEEAIKFKRLDIVKFLVAEGADLKADEKKGNSILKIAESIENNQVIVFFLRKEIVKRRLKALFELNE